MIDFSRPLQGRKWLQLLVEDSISGIRIKPSLHLSKRALGFTFSSNKIGLRGPASTSAPAVVLGTSYAMGFAVDDGKNWYDGLLRPDSWFNAGLPVGPFEWQGLLTQHYRGDRRLAVFLYHPNTWPHALTYWRQRTSGVGAFAHFGWKTEFWDCVRLHFRRSKHKSAQEREGKRLVFSQRGQTWCVDSSYSYIAPSQEHSELSAVSCHLVELLASFSEVLVLRIPIKEEFLPPELTNDHFERAKQSYQHMWDFSQTLLRGHRKISLETVTGFGLPHYHGFDTHLNEYGNEHLRTALRGHLKARGYTHLLA